MRALSIFHRWLGIPCCLLFAMWFATGMVMHFVPFPALSEAERIEGLATIDTDSVTAGPVAAVRASGSGDATRISLRQRFDGAVYLVMGSTSLKAHYARDLSSAKIKSEITALAIARDHARRRNISTSLATFVELSFHDQWTVPNGLDLHRPLYRVALNDAAGTELYVSSATGDVVRDTTRRERWWNYAGSVMHWIYPTFLRRNWVAWDRAGWTLSLVAVMAALTGAVLGVLRVKRSGGRVGSPYRGWHAWHHGLGLISTTFVLTYILSGWLSMDHGRLFSTGNVTTAEALAITGSPDWASIDIQGAPRVAGRLKEIEWFAFGGKIYRRDRAGLDAQQLFLVTPTAGNSTPGQPHLRPDEVSAIGARLQAACQPAVPVDVRDSYHLAQSMPSAPVVRLVCGDVWIHIDSANGAIAERLDSSRRAYRWLYSGLHTLDFPALIARPMLRTALIMALCGCGLIFSLTGVVIAWRRLKLSLGAQVR